MKTDKVICVACPTCERIVAGECLDYVTPEGYSDIGRMVTEAFRNGRQVVARVGPVTMGPCGCERMKNVTEDETNYGLPRELR